MEVPLAWMGRLHPRAPTSDLQGFLPLDPPLNPPIAVLLQPKCVRSDVNATAAKGLRRQNGPSICSKCFVAQENDLRALCLFDATTQFVPQEDGPHGWYHEAEHAPSV